MIARSPTGGGHDPRRGGAGQARAIARNLVQANLMGHDSHGVGLAPRYMDHAQEGQQAVGAEVIVVSDNGAYCCFGNAWAMAR